MVDISLELDQMEELRAELEDLEAEWDDEPIWAVGTNVEYAVYLEFGTRDMPPYPWFRPAIREFEANPEGFIRENTAYKSIDAIPNVETFVEAVASALTNRMTANVNAQDPSADRSPGVDPEHPQRDTGNLTNSIKAVRVQ